MCIGKSLDGLVNVLAIIDSHRPFLVSLYRVFRGGAHGGIGIGFFDNRRFVRCVSSLVTHVVQRDDSAFEGHLAEILPANLIECSIRLCDRIVH